MTVYDDFFLDPAEDMLACLQVACEDSIALNPPANFTLMGGEQTLVDLGPTIDYCCDGLGVVRFNLSYPNGSQPFPQPATGVEPCSATNYTMIMEASIWRCYPSGDDQGNAPSLTEISNAAKQQLDDVATLYRALCCFKKRRENSPQRETVFGSNVQPVGPGGGCAGVAMSVYTSVTGCAACD